jgi:hypothetical protein
MDAALGLIHLRVPTWCPFRLQFYCNGHSWLARQLAAAGIGFVLADNAFTRIGDFARAQQLADNFSPDRLHSILDRYAEQCCPVLDVFRQTSGASPRSNTQPTSCSARRRYCSRSTSSFAGRPC